MRKKYVLLLVLLTFFEMAHAGFEIEHETAPAYYPHTAVSTGASPSTTMRAPTAPATTPPNQSAELQKIARPPEDSERTGSDAASAKALLAQDVARAIAARPAKLSKEEVTDVRLGKLPDGASMQKVNEDFALTKPLAVVKPTEPAASSNVIEVTVPNTSQSNAEPMTTSPQDAPNMNSVVQIMPPLKAEPLPSWQAVPGDTLRSTVENWAQREGWDVRWEADLLDYPIEEPFSLVGKFLDVITQTFELYKEAKRPFRVEVYPPQTLIVVKEKK